MSNSNLAPNSLSAVQAAARIREGSLKSEELVAACLSRIEETDDQVKAWAYLNKEEALGQARALDDMRLRGRPMGPLHGVPVGLKDIIDTRDQPTERGSAIFAGRQPDQDAAIVERLREAGAVILGKTKTTELAFVHPTDTCNPHDTSRTPGGSSSGSAAAVASYQVPLAVGTQTNGSVIRPASFCGTYGFKPTRGMVSRSGVLQTSQSLDQLGVFARNGEDVALLVDVIAGYDQRDTASHPRARPQVQQGWNSEAPVEPNFIWIDLPYHDRLADDVREGMEEVIEALGGQIERFDGAKNLANLVEVQRIIHEYEIVHHLEQTFSQHWDQVSDTLKPIVERGRSYSLEQYEDALGVMRSAEVYFEEFFHDYDAVLAPSAPGQAPLIADGGTGDPIFSTVWTTAGLPCVTMPLLVGDKGLPVGLQLIGGAEQDDRLMRTAHWLLKHLGIA